MSGREYHWILTLSWPCAVSPGNSWSGEGTIVGPSSGKRQDVFHALIAGVRELEPAIPENYHTVFFALEPNDLGGES